MRWFLLTLVFFLLWPHSTTSAADVTDALRVLNAVGKEGQGHREAMTAWRVIANTPSESLPTLLKAIDDSKVLAANWIRAAVDQIAERTLENGRTLPTDELEHIVFDESYAPRARRLSYEWLCRVDPAAEARIIPKMLDSSSLEMRREAVSLVLREAASLDDQPAAIERFRRALTSARDTDQIDEAYRKLAELGVDVDLPRHFGFITKWHLIGPFDNSDKLGFDTVYPPEKTVSLDQEYQGKQGLVRWLTHATADPYGMVNLNEAIGKHMGAVAYAFTEFVSPEARDVDLRLGAINAAKVWLNGELLMSHEVYHAGTKIDQYVAHTHLRRGKNELLLKICQNEQTDDWAQDWQFQFRVCDHLGTAVHSVER